MRTRNKLLKKKMANEITKEIQLIFFLCEIIQIGINICTFKFTGCSKGYKPYRIIVSQIENNSNKP